MNIIGAIFGLFFNRRADASKLIVQPMTDELGGMPLDYLIGNSNIQNGAVGRITEVGYHINVVPKNGVGIAYCNLFEEDFTGKYGPYLYDSDTAQQYGEGQIDPRGVGWELNLREQFKRRRKSKFKYIELDNPDAYKTKDVIGAIELAAEYDLRVIAKNPFICAPDPVSYLSHGNIYGAIVERGAGSPKDMDELRRNSKRPNLPVWFVYFGSGKPVADETAKIIKNGGYKNMGVTYSEKGEYGSSMDVLKPVKP